MVSNEQAAAILRRARAAGLDTLDTAMSYGTSEQTLGALGADEWRVVTKLPALPDGRTDVEAWAREATLDSLCRLNLNRVYGLLLHRPRDLLSAHGADLYAAMKQLKADGLVDRIGISIYAPSDLDELAGRYSFDIVQAPVSILDRRLQVSGWMRRLRDRGVEIHARSVFLQGLMLMAAEHRPPRFAQWQPLWAEWDAWLRHEGLSALEACLRFVIGLPDVDRIVVGVDSLQQLDEILAVVPRGIDVPASLSSSDLDLIDPSRWNSQ